MTKNTDPTKLDETNIGDSIVLRMPDGSTQSAKILTVFASKLRVVVGWAVGPGRIKTETLFAPEWKHNGRIVAIFPEGAKFLAV